jgi:outer membrane immunogenic protein
VSVGQQSSGYVLVNLVTRARYPRFDLRKRGGWDMRILISIFGVSALLIMAPLEATAADMATKAPPPTPIPAPAWTWAGYYTGGHVGGAWGDLQVNDYNEVPGIFSNEPSGVFGGLQFGYNFQWGQFIYGVEVDTGGMDLNKAADQPGTNSLIQSVIKGGFYGDITSRFGYAWNSSLIYVKGGYAYYNDRVHVVDAGDPSVTNESNQSGWTIGGGFEQMISPNWSWKLEYQYFDFGGVLTILPSDGDIYNNKLAVQSVKVGINYHFR